MADLYAGPVGRQLLQLEQQEFELRYSLENKILGICTIALLIIGVIIVHYPKRFGYDMLAITCLSLVPIVGIFFSRYRAYLKSTRNQLNFIAAEEPEELVAYTKKVRIEIAFLIFYGVIGISTLLTFVYILIQSI